MIDDIHIRSWQSTLDMLAEVFKVPAALIMTLKDGRLEVLVSSCSVGNPYKVGDNEVFDGSGLYCERVIKSKSELLVANAFSDEEWKDNPDIKLGMISYLGFPLSWPNGEPFGTICVLDKEENSYSIAYVKLLGKFKEHVELDLILLKKEIETRDKNEQLERALADIKTLQGIIPICGYCHEIRDEKGGWVKLAMYVSQHTEAEFSFGVCPKCNPEE